MNFIHCFFYITPTLGTLFLTLPQGLQNVRDGSELIHNLQKTILHTRIRIYLYFQDYNCQDILILNKKHSPLARQSKCSLFPRPINNEKIDNMVKNTVYGQAAPYLKGNN